MECLYDSCDLCEKYTISENTIITRHHIAKNV